LKSVFSVENKVQSQEKTSSTAAQVFSVTRDKPQRIQRISLSLSKIIKHSQENLRGLKKSWK